MGAFERQKLPLPQLFLLCAPAGVWERDSFPPSFSGARVREARPPSPTGPPSRLVTRGPGKVISGALGRFPLPENTTQLKRSCVEDSRGALPKPLSAVYLEAQVCPDHTDWGREKATQGPLSTRHRSPAVPQGPGYKGRARGRGVWHHQPPHPIPTSTQVGHPLRLGSGTTGVTPRAVPLVLQGHRHGLSRS